MARFRARMSYADTRAELRDHKDIKRGAGEDAFWDEDELIDYRPSRKSKKKKKPGCPENNNGPHVWVWVEWWPGSRYETKVCCGCEKRNRGSKSFRVKP